MTGPARPRPDRRRIYLMRHAEAAYVGDDGRRATDSRLVPLTARGRAQALAMRAALAEAAFDRVVVSGLPRTVETARLVLGDEARGLETVPALEEIHPGDPSQIPPAHFEMEMIHGMSRAAEPGARFLGGEAFADFEARVVPAFEALIAAPGWSTMLLVAHGGTNRMILGWACDSGRKVFSAFEQDSGCLNILDVDMADGRAQRALVRMANFTPYNATKQGMMATTMESLLKAILAARSD